ncbi:unnamed protein product, partial [Symbiodinium microadriaticum]
VPTSSFQLPRGAATRVVAPEDRENPLDGLSVRVWIGRLSSDWARYLEVVAIGEADLELNTSFGDALEAEHADCIPFAPDLVEAAGDRIAYQTAEEDPDGPLTSDPAQRGADPPWANRVEELERGMGDLRKGIEEILGRLEKPAERASAKEPPPRPSALRTRAAASPGAGLAGLDPAVVQAARAAGVPESHLEEMAKVVAQSKTKLKDPGATPKASSPIPQSGVGPLDETEEEDELDEEAPLCRPGAIRRRATTLEGLLEGGAGSEGPGLGGAGRRNAAALKVLRRALVDRPRELADGMADGILERMGADFGLA